MQRLHLLFVYKDEKPYNSMGIKGTVDELYDEAKKISEEILKDSPKSEIKTKLVFWD
ncbi:hypothetical protein NBRC13296_12505 [Paenibacillus chitinolyticus]|uniref:hypothetical protein n=1 Tax=Paenibacillus chitinolyticus TaxID=79263 RepID=UPI0035590920